MFSCQFYEKWVPVREMNVKLLLETVTYIATAESVTCKITVDIVMCIMHFLYIIRMDQKCANDTVF